MYVRRALELEVSDYPVRLVLDLCPGFLTRDRELEEVEDIGVCALPPAARRRQCEVVGASSGGSVPPALADRVGRAAAAGLAGGALADPPPTADRRQRPAGEQQQPRQQHGAVGQRLEAMRPGSAAEGIEIYALYGRGKTSAKGAEVRGPLRPLQLRAVSLSLDCCWGRSLRALRTSVSFLGLQPDHQPSPAEETLGVLCVCGLRHGWAWRRRVHRCRDSVVTLNRPPARLDTRTAARDLRAVQLHSPQVSSIAAACSAWRRAGRSRCYRSLCWRSGRSAVRASARPALLRSSSNVAPYHPHTHA
jgi:hypothetical protein